MTHTGSWLIRFPLAGLLLASLGCGLADLFRPSGPDGVVLTYQGETRVSVDSTIPFAIVVEVGGAVVPDPRLLLSIDDTSRVVLTPGNDSLRGKSNGNTDLIVRFPNSLFGDSPPTLVTRIHVQQ